MTSPYDRPQPVLHTTTARGEKITLRLADDRDTDAIVRTCRDPETLRYTTIPLGYDTAMAHSFIHEYVPGWWSRQRGACWVIADADDRYTGQIDLRVKATDPAVGDVGFVTDPLARGRGHMTAALRAVAWFGLRELGLHRIEWRAHVGNDGSRRVAERAGFRFEGVIRAGCPHRGERVDCWLAAIIRTDLEDLV